MFFELKDTRWSGECHGFTIMFMFFLFLTVNPFLYQNIAWISTNSYGVSGSICFMKYLKNFSIKWIEKNYPAKKTPEIVDISNHYGQLIDAWFSTENIFSNTSFMLKKYILISKA